MAEQTTHIRVSKETRRRLRELQERLASASERGQATTVVPERRTNNPAACEVSADQVIAWLLGKDDAWRERQKKAREKRKKKKAV